MKNLLFFVISMGFILAAPQFSMAAIPIQNSDAETLDVISVVDQNEVQMAQLTEGKDVDRHVFDYAKMLEHDHGKNLKQVRELSQKLGIVLDDNSGTAAQLRADGQNDLNMMTPMNQGGFSKEFISHMIKGHSAVLDWIDRQGSQNEKVKSFLRETQKIIAKHLKKAQDIQEHVLK